MKAWAELEARYRLGGPVSAWALGRVDRPWATKQFETSATTGLRVDL